jgi:hypothetical protein
MYVSTTSDPDGRTSKSSNQSRSRANACRGEEEEEEKCQINERGHTGIDMAGVTFASKVDAATHQLLTATLGTNMAACDSF